MEYNEEIIESTGVFNIEQWLLSFARGDDFIVKKLYAESSKVKGRNSVVLESKIALENYVLKYYSQPKTQELKKAMDLLVRQVGSGFSKGNIEMLNSAFLKSENVSCLYKGNSFTSVERAMTSLKRRTFGIYQKFSKGIELDVHEKKLLMKYFSYCRDAHIDTKIYQAQLHYMKYLYRNYLDNLTNLDELEFVSNFTVANYFRFFHKDVVEPTVIISDLGKSSRGKNTTHHTIMINENPNAFVGRIETLKTINHECRHAVQSKYLKGERNLSAYEMAKRQLFSKYLNTRDYNSYKVNYRFESIEKDADKNGYFKTRVMLNTIIDSLEERKKVDFYLRDKEIEENRRRAFPFAYVVDEKEKKHIPEDYEFQKLREIVGAHPEVVSEYPVLQILFYKDGSVKSFEEILTTREHLGIINQDVCYDFLRVGVKNNLLDKIAVQNMDDYQKRVLFGRLLDLFQDEAKKVGEAFECYGTAKNIDEETYYHTMNNHIAILKKLIQYIGKNMNLVYQLERNNAQDGYCNNCNLSTFKRGVETYARAVKKYGSIGLVGERLKELETMMVDNYGAIEELRKYERVS